MPWRFAGLIVESDVPFHDLPSVSGPPDIVIRRGATALGPWTEVQTWPESDGSEWLAIDRGDAAYRLRFADLRCTISADGSAIVIDDGSPADGHALVHLLLHQVLPLAISRRDRLVLHACAVETPYGAIAFLGGSGAGKSTLAAAFCARGHALVADDALVVDIGNAGIDVSPTADGLRLWDDFASSLPPAFGSPSGPSGQKLRLGAPLASRVSPLTALFLIGATTPEIVIDRVAPSAARIALLSHLFRLDVGDTLESRRLFDAVHTLATRLPMHTLEYPDGIEFLAPLVTAMFARLDGG